MPREWRVELEDLGRIVSADVAVKPFTMLVGRNNSGKSYLASLLWGIESGAMSAVPVDDNVVPMIEGWLVRSRASGRWLAWTEAEQRALQLSWTNVIENSGAVLGSWIFNDERLRWHTRSLSPSNLDQSWYGWCAPQTVMFSTLANLPPPHEAGFRRVLAESSRYQLFGQGSLTTDEVQVDARTLFDLSGWSVPVSTPVYRNGHPIYLPASRTGFALFLKTYVQSSVTRGFDSRPRSGGPDNTSDERFTRPQTHLMSALAAGFGGEPGPFADEAGRLERECLDGAIEAAGEFGVARYGFRPSGGVRLGLHVSSALVTELLPLVIALRNAQSIPFLVLEEPEAHLHPRLQRAVIRCLARLVRRGVRVLITTHSSTVAQQVNNLVKLGALDADRRARFGYAPEEYLALDEVSVHEFVFRPDGRTVVEPAEPQPGGFPLPTFNETLQAMAQETLALNAALDEKGID